MINYHYENLTIAYKRANELKTRSRNLSCFDIIFKNAELLKKQGKIYFCTYKDATFGLIKTYCDDYYGEMMFKFYDPIFKEYKEVSLMNVNEKWIENKLYHCSLSCPCSKDNISTKIKEIVEEEKEFLSLINQHNKMCGQSTFEYMPDYVLIGDFRYPKSMMLYMPKKNLLLFRCEGKTVSQNISKYDARKYFETHDISILFEVEREYYRSQKMREDISLCLG